MYDPSKDGVDHINVYSHGKTALGQFLSNFAHTPIETKHGKFNSIEGYWYWLAHNDDELRDLYGYKAKLLGHKLKTLFGVGGRHKDFNELIKAAILVKLKGAPTHIAKEFRESTLPLVHYYIFGKKVLEPKSNRWVIEYLEELRGDKLE